MKVVPTRHRQKIGEAQVAKLVELVGHSWREAGRESTGLDGYIEIVRGGLLSGQIIGVQVKSGRSFLTTYKKAKDISRRLPIPRRKIKLRTAHLTYFKECRFPVIVVLHDPNSDNVFWGAVALDSSSAFPVPNTLDRFAARSLARVADLWHSNYPKFVDPGLPPISIRVVKKEARDFYEGLRQRQLSSPAYGVVRFTLRGWRHITRQNAERSKVVRSLQLLGAAERILSQQDTYHVCRKTDAGHILCKQTARISHPNRADAIVSVITEQIGDGPPQFLSVYEHSPPRQKAKRRRKVPMRK